MRMTEEARSGFDAAVLRVLRARYPEVRFRPLRDEADALADATTAARDDDGLQAPARQLA